ncbi:hypothetical protein NQ318_004318 [Aromia moschata]|uniref:Uncharacterized protein n=1 Tax=Aromia moschata TaxID=1265417 RepID=A0AAV8YTM0_9CUCU|nr:hypothetical protein NQ318_004318 [Aromia moschata]
MSVKRFFLVAFDKKKETASP